MANWGLPYKGSKNKIAASIHSLLPRRDNLYDLFMGGGAVTHYALAHNKFKNVFSNDINWMCPTLFKDVLDGKYINEDRWISREDFEELKDKDPYVAFVWSFGNNLRDYIYGKEIEPFKKALHYLLMYNDPSLIKEQGYDLEYITKYASVDRRYDEIRKFFLKLPPPNASRPRSQRCQSHISHISGDWKSADVRAVEAHPVNSGGVFSDSTKCRPSSGAEEYKHSALPQCGTLQLEHYTRSQRLAISGGVIFRRTTRVMMRLRYSQIR